jgi:anti-sigma regulatory factor (Ser/Thr protein kinase)
VVLGVDTRDDPVDHGFLHKAMLYGGDEEFVTGVMPFVTEAVRDGSATLVAVAPDKIERLRAELGDDADGVLFVDMFDLGANPARIIPAWHDFVDANDGRPLRGVGEPIWPGRDGAHLVECQLHEALLNVAFDGTASFELLCPYDVTTLAHDVITAAHHTHPIVRNGQGEQHSDSYASEWDATAIFASSLPPPAERPTELRFTTGPLHDLRSFVDEQARRAGVADARVGDTVLAANEIASNSLLHGGGAGVVRTWRDNGTFVCEIRDHGHIADVLVGRKRPPQQDTAGRGVWMANQLCDLVQVRSSELGTAIRLHVLVDGCSSIESAEPTSGL